MLRLATNAPPFFAYFDINEYFVGVFFFVPISRSLFLSFAFPSQQQTRRKDGNDRYKIFYLFIFESHLYFTIMSFIINYKDMT